MYTTDQMVAVQGDDLQLDQHGLIVMLMLVLMGGKGRGGDRLQLLGCHHLLLLLLGVLPIIDRTATHWTHRQPT
jgi:hypothetical protein